MTKVNNLIKGWNDNAYNMKHIRALAADPKKEKIKPYVCVIGLRPATWGESFTRAYQRIFILWNAIFHPTNFDKAIELIERRQQNYKKNHAAIENRIVDLTKRIWDIAINLDSSSKQKLAFREKELLDLDVQINVIDYKLKYETDPLKARDLVLQKDRLQGEYIHILTKQLEEIQLWKSSVKVKGEEEQESTRLDSTKLVIEEEEQIPNKHENLLETEPSAQTRQQELDELTRKIDNEKKILREMLGDIKNKFKEEAHKIGGLQEKIKSLEEQHKSKILEQENIKRELSPFATKAKSLREQLDKDQKTKSAVDEQLQKLDVEMAKAEDELKRLDLELKMHSERLEELGTILQKNSSTMSEYQKILMKTPPKTLSWLDKVQGKKLEPTLVEGLILSLQGTQQENEKKCNEMRLQILNLKNEQEVAGQEAEINNKTKERFLDYKNNVSSQFEVNDKLLIACLQEENKLLERQQKLSLEIADLEKGVLQLKDQLAASEDSQSQLKQEWDAGKDSCEISGFGDKTLEVSLAADEISDNGSESLSKGSTASTDSPIDEIQFDIFESQISEASQIEGQKSLQGKQNVETLNDIKSIVFQIQTITETSAIKEIVVVEKNIFIETPTIEEKKQNPLLIAYTVSSGRLKTARPIPGLKGF